MQVYTYEQQLGFGVTAETQKEFPPTGIGVVARDSALECSPNLVNIFPSDGRMFAEETVGNLNGMSREDRADLAIIKKISFVPESFALVSLRHNGTFHKPGRVLSVQYVNRE